MEISSAPTGNIRSNPSRRECEDIIHRILITELLENGGNSHFKKATDFMKYFESLYPASDALTKQVQRAVKSMNMPKDERGYFIPDKTPEQMEEDNQISRLLGSSSSGVCTLGEVSLVHVNVDARHRSYLASLISDSTTFSGKFITLIETGTGILFITEKPAPLQLILESLIERGS